MLNNLKIATYLFTWYWHKASYSLPSVPRRPMPQERRIHHFPMHWQNSSATTHFDTLHGVSDFKLMCCITSALPPTFIPGTGSLHTKLRIFCPLFPDDLSRRKEGFIFSSASFSSSSRPPYPVSLGNFLEADVREAAKGANSTAKLS